MDNKHAGISGLNISPITFGCWSLGGDYFGAIEKQQGIACVKTYLEHGITTFDNAELYGKGQAEELLGSALRGVDREKYTLISKVWPTHYSAEDMEKACVDSMKRLNTDYLDVYFLHYPPRGMSIASVVENMMRLKDKGMIRAIGVSNFTLDMLKEARQAAEVEFIQPCYNLLWRYADRDLLPYCVEQGIAVIPYSTLAQGLLTGKLKAGQKFNDGRAGAALFQPGIYEQCLEVTAVLSEVGKKYDKTAAQVCISWLIKNSSIASPIVGGADEKHALQNIAAMDFTLDKADYELIDETSKAFCRQMPEYELFFSTKTKEEPACL